MYKRVISLFLALLILCCFAGCGVKRQYGGTGEILEILPDVPAVMLDTDQGQIVFSVKNTDGLSVGDIVEIYVPEGSLAMSSPAHFLSKYPCEVKIVEKAE